MKLFKIKLLRLFFQIKNLLDLKSDFDESGTYALINAGAEFKSGNAWGLIFAIFIASIGLNVNSTAVIIGAMLISPLMGPIVGSGFSLATHDFELLKKSIKNIAYAVMISILTSSLFFLISPSGSIKSELLARTQPTIFDVLIAFFGGAAGIIATTRVVKGNAVPGVAIATALMPPLCTIGYGIAHFKFQYALGALYLFLINTVFILIATYLFTRILGFKIQVDRNPTRDQTIHRYMTWGSFVFIIPSIIMAWYLHKQSQFESDANRFINSEFSSATTLVAKKEIIFDLKNPRIDVFVFGEEINEEQQKKINGNLSLYPSLEKTILNIRGIQREKISLNDLEEKFITRSEFSQLLKIEDLNKKISFNKDMAKVLHELKIKFNDQISDLEIDDNKVKIFWKSKPTLTKMSHIELEIYQTITNKKLNFSHSIAIR